MRNSIKLMLMLIIAMSLVSGVSNLDIPLPTALGDSYGTFQIDESVELIQTCSNETAPCDYCNITSLRYPDGTAAVVNVVMTKNTAVFNYTLSAILVNTIGKYAVTGFCTAGGVYSPWAYTFDITESGVDVSEGTAIMRGFALIILLGIGFFFIFFASTTESSGVKLFLSMMGYIFVLITSATSYIILKDNEIFVGVANIGFAALFILIIIFIVIMYYIFINLTKTALAMWRAKKGFGSELDNPATF